MSTSTVYEMGRYVADAGQIGGDRQLSAAPSRRFVLPREDGTYTVITESAYVVPGVDTHLEDFRPRIHGYAVENVTEIMHCRDLEDVGGTEINCEYEYEIVNYTSISMKADALSVARQFILNLDAANYGS
jgi:hypothetical protein